MTQGIIIKVSVFKDKIIFSIPAGKREIGETAWEAAVRETKEEVGIDIEHHFRLNPNGGGGESYVMSFNLDQGVLEGADDNCGEKVALYDDSHLVGGISSLKIN